MEKNKTTDKNITVYGSPNSSSGYVIRDFLKRSLVTFDWIPVETISGLKALFPGKISSKAQLPLVMLPGDVLLYNPSVEDIACKLGWITKPKHTEYDVSIFGAGPAGLSAAVYAASEGLRTVLVEREAIGGQAGTSSRIENYLGFPNGISGSELAERAKQQAIKFGVDLLLIRRSLKAEFIDRKLHVDMVDGSKIIARSNISATGVEYSRLNLPQEDRFLNLGIYYGAGASEALLCANQHVFVVGGGNSAGQAVLTFSKHAKKVTMVIRGNDLESSLSYYLLARIKKRKNVEVLYHSAISELHGETTLDGITITDTVLQETASYLTKFVFVCIGGKPNTNWAENTPIVRDEAGYLVTGNDLLKPPFAERWSRAFNPAFLETSVPGCFAAGDVRLNSIKRVASAVGEGAMAVTFVHRYLHENY